MFKEEFEAKLIGNRLHLKYFQGDVIVDVQGEKDALSYLVRQANVLEKLKCNLLKEADKFTRE